MKNNLIRIIFFILIIILPPAMWAGIRYYNPTLHNELQYDLGENRDKTVITSFKDVLTNGNIISDYYADRAPFRSSIVKSYQRIDGKFEKIYDSFVMPLAMKLYNNSSENASLNEEYSDYHQTGEEAFNNLFGDDSEDTEDKEEEEITTQPAVNEHKYVEVDRKDSDCFVEGYVKYICSDCGDVMKEKLPKREHSYIFAGNIPVSYEAYGCNLYFCEYCTNQKKEDIVDKLIDTSYMAPILKQNEVIIGRSGWLFLAGDGNLSYYLRENVLSDEEMNEYSRVLSELNKLCVEKGKKFAVIIAPNKDQVYSEYMPSYTFSAKEKRTEKLVNHIKANTTVPIAYAYDELKYADRYWQTYYKYDSHWNMVGAFIGTQTLLSLIGKDVTSPMDIRIYEDFRYKPNDLISLGALNDEDFPLERDYFVGYKPEVVTEPLTEGEIDLATFYRTASNVGDNSKCVFVGDSYRINMIPFVSKEFSECSFVYRDNLWEAMDYIEDADTIIIESVERLDYKLIDTATWFIEFLKQQ